MRRRTQTRARDRVARVALCAILLAAGSCGRHAHEPAATTRDGAPRATAASDTAARATTAVATVDSTTGAAAAEVVRRYYAAIAAREYRAAYALWEGDGAASGKTFAAFAVGFAHTAHVAADVGTPGPIDAAAGSRYVEIPVEVRATTREGTAQRFAGSYVLRRSEVDGASATQRRWHLYSAKLHQDAAAHP